jgi:hypothetical protein
VREWSKGGSGLALDIVIIARLLCFFWKGNHIRYEKKLNLKRKSSMNGGIATACLKECIYASWEDYIGEIYNNLGHGMKIFTDVTVVFHLHNSLEYK